MKKLLIIALCLLPLHTYAQNTPQEIVDDFFELYKKNPGDAMRKAYGTNAWSERSKDEIENVAQRLNGLTPEVIGEYHGFELITTKKFSDSFVLHSYLIKYDRQPLRFIFKFYKPKDEWTLYAFKFDDKFSEEIEEAAKLYYLLGIEN